MMFDAEGSLDTLKRTLQAFSHPRSEATAARTDLERALGLAQMALNNFKPEAYSHPKTLERELTGHIEMAKLALQAAPTAQR